MPNHRQQRPAGAGAAGGGAGGGGGHQARGGPQDQENRDPQAVPCCLPSGCPRSEDLIQLGEPGDAVRVLCNNEGCDSGSWMHGGCFNEWEQGVLSYLRSCGRARSWSEKQRLQNLWTKKGYDLAYKACDCSCGRGHLRKDLDYVPKAKPEDLPGKKNKNKKKRHEKQLPVLQKAPGNHGPRPQLRIRTASFSSTGSSPPSSADTPPLTPSTSAPGPPVSAGAAAPQSGGGGKKSKFEFFADADQAAAGNIFRRREDFSAFSVLPRHLQNPYHIKMEDEGPHGNDEIRCFVLSNLSSHQVTSVHCVLCGSMLPVFDRYPLIDGTFFLSPQRYNSDLQVLSDHRLVYLNALCMSCLQPEDKLRGGRDLRCRACRRRWDGSTLVLGTMYSYDVFAAMPCCAARLSCKCCRRPVLDPGCTFQFYSQYSRSTRCPSCRREDFHFVKPLQDIFFIKSQQPICN